MPHDEAQRGNAKGYLRGSWRRKGSVCWAGARFRRTMLHWARRRGLPSRSLRQVFIGRNASLADDLAFERKLYVIRKRAENAIRYSGKVKGGEYFLPGKPVVEDGGYKGMLIAGAGGPYYPDLKHPAMESALALIHSRFSTNTFPSWNGRSPIVTWAHNARSTRCGATFFSKKKNWELGGPPGPRGIFFFFFSFFPFFPLYLCYSISSTCYLLHR